MGFFCCMYVRMPLRDLNPHYTLLCAVLLFLNQGACPVFMFYVVAEDFFFLCNNLSGIGIDKEFPVPCISIRILINTIQPCFFQDRSDTGNAFCLVLMPVYALYAPGAGKLVLYALCHSSLILLAMSDTRIYFFVSLSMFSAATSMFFRLMTFNTFTWA